MTVTFPDLKRTPMIQFLKDLCAKVWAYIEKDLYNPFWGEW